MTLHFEIVPASRGLAVMETYIEGRRTAMTSPMPVAAARLRGESSGADVVDHTQRTVWVAAR